MTQAMTQAVISLGRQEVKSLMLTAMGSMYSSRSVKPGQGIFIGMSKILKVQEINNQSGIHSQHSIALQRLLIQG